MENVDNIDRLFSDWEALSSQSLLPQGLVYSNPQIGNYLVIEDGITGSCQELSCLLAVMYIINYE